MQDGFLLSLVSSLFSVDNVMQPDEDSRHYVLYATTTSAKHPTTVPADNLSNKKCAFSGFHSQALKNQECSSLLNYLFRIAYNLSNENINAPWLFPEQPHIPEEASQIS